MTQVEEPADVAGMASTVPVGRRRASQQRSAEKPASVTAGKTDTKKYDKDNK